MTLEASVELERIAAQVREDALLLDLVQSTPIGGLLDGLHREARADAVVAEIEPFSARESYVNLQRCSHRCQFARDETRGGCIVRCGFVSVPKRIGEHDLSRKRQFAILPSGALVGIALIRDVLPFPWVAQSN